MAEGNLSQQRAVSLLQEATRLIREYPGSSNDVSSAQVASPNVISQSESHATTSSAGTAVNTLNPERVLGNFRNLFAPYGHAYWSPMSKFLNTVVSNTSTTLIFLSC